MVVRALYLVEYLRRQRLRVAAARASGEAAVEVRPVRSEMRAARLEGRRVAYRDEFYASFYIRRGELAEEPYRGEYPAVLSAVDAGRDYGVRPLGVSRHEGYGKIYTSAVLDVKVNDFCFFAAHC